MPSIPQSLLWISLVVLWLFVLVPMLISKRDAVRRTSDVALATRVLNGGAGARLLKRGGPATGHRSDPDWKPDEPWRHEPVDEELDDDDVADGQDEEREQDPDQGQDAHEKRRGDVSVMTFAGRQTAGDDEPDYLDVDVVDEDSGALPAGASARGAEPGVLAVDGAIGEAEVEADDVEAEGDYEADDGTRHRADLERDHDRAADEYEYEYVEDSSGLEPDEDDPQHDYDASPTVAMGSSRRRRFDTSTAAAVSARKYAFRKRVLMVMAAVLVGSAVAAFEITPSAWWICGIATAVTVLYLGYLRRQTRIEAKVRRRRAQRMARSRLGVENTHDRAYDVVPERLRRPGAVVLEIDDEDPAFAHLDYATPGRSYGWPRDLPRAVGQ
ncbi:divisome protein SepX/GlpR [Mycobacterium spongiae]|uniref:Transmembrane protein n=1 Tax=Mycobacterium spongiae TaxID=886343 RepID=A0A975PYC2_9MYCO|nr:gephyrin-like molybdotransferase receptor GlpR [Mycobacterium spongiae]QUR68714.1 hypothetical protein F6B93_17990 [Mycobacterium spongiae]